MTTAPVEPAVAVLAVEFADQPRTIHRFVETAEQDTDPYHQALATLAAVREQHPQVTHTLLINDRALDLATVTMMDSAGFTDYTLIDAEQTRQVIDEMEAQR